MATVSIKDLPPISGNLGGNEVFPVDYGSTTKKATLNNVKDFIVNQLPEGLTPAQLNTAIQNHNISPAAHEDIRQANEEMMQAIENLQQNGGGGGGGGSGGDVSAGDIVSAIEDVVEVTGMLSLSGVYDFIFPDKPPDWVKYGYTFIGWSLTPDLRITGFVSIPQRTTLYSPGEKMQLTESIEIYAVWLKTESKRIDEPRIQTYGSASNYVWFIGDTNTGIGYGVGNGQALTYYLGDNGEWIFNTYNSLGNIVQTNSGIWATGGRQIRFAMPQGNQPFTPNPNLAIGPFIQSVNGTLYWFIRRVSGQVSETNVQYVSNSVIPQLVRVINGIWWIDSNNTGISYEDDVPIAEARPAMFVRPTNRIGGQNFILPPVPSNIIPAGKRFVGWCPGLPNFAGTSRGTLIRPGDIYEIRVDTDFYAVFENILPATNPENIIVGSNPNGSSGFRQSTSYNPSKKELSTKNAILRHKNLQQYTPFYAYGSSFNLPPGFYFITNVNLTLSLAGLSLPVSRQKHTWENPYPGKIAYSFVNGGFSYPVSHFSQEGTPKDSTPSSAKSVSNATFEHIVVLPGINMAASAGSGSSVIYGYISKL